jgi:hypothetical protein
MIRRMAGRQDFIEYFDDFFGSGASVPSSADPATPWLVTDTSSAGTPTYVIGVNGVATGALAVAMDSQNEAQNVCISHGDILSFDINDLLSYECRIKTNAAAMTSGSSLAFGMTGLRNDAIDSIAQAALFRVIGADSTTLVVCESDDGTTDKDDVATGITLINAFKYFKIDFSNLSSVKFYGGDSAGRLIRLAKTTTFDLSAYTGCLQPYFQLQKTATANTNGFSADYVRIVSKRGT